MQSNHDATCRRCFLSYSNLDVEEDSGLDSSVAYLLPCAGACVPVANKLQDDDRVQNGRADKLKAILEVIGFDENRG